MGIESISFPNEYDPKQTPREFFLKMYDWESLYDMSRDLEEAVSCDNAKFRKTTGADKGGEFKGQIRITMEFIPDNG